MAVKLGHFSTEATKSNLRKNYMKWWHRKVE